MGDQTVFLIGLLIAILSVLIIFGGFFSYYFFFSRSVKKEEPEEEPFDKVDQIPTEIITTKNLQELIIELNSSLQVKQDDILKSFGAIMQGFVNPTKQGEMAEGLLEIIFDKSGIPEDLYDTQKTSKEVRPDVIVSLPGNSKLIVDSKCVTNKYFEAFKTEDEVEREELLGQNAKNLVDEAKKLSKKKYDEIEGSLSFVVMFIPWDAIYSDATRREPEFLVNAYSGFAAKGSSGTPIIVATPSTIGSLLKIVNMMWTERNLYANISEVKKALEKMYISLKAFNEDFKDSGKSFLKSSHHLRLAYKKYTKIFPELKILERNVKEISMDIVPEDQFMNKEKLISLEEEDISKLERTVEEAEKNEKED